MMTFCKNQAADRYTYQAININILPAVALLVVQPMATVVHGAMNAMAAMWRYHWWSEIAMLLIKLGSRQHVATRIEAAISDPNR